MKLKVPFAPAKAPHAALLAAPLAAAILLGTAAALWAEDKPAALPLPKFSTVVATVDGHEITAGQIALMRKQLPQQYQTMPNDVLFDALLDQAVNQQLFSDELKTEPATIAAVMENERRALRAAQAVQTVAEAAVTDEALKALYDEKFANAEPSREFSAAHILVGSEEEAKEIATQLKNGTAFEDLAKSKSLDPSGHNGGDLGWFGKGMMVPQFEEAVAALKPGEVSEPVQTQFGWHLILLKETRLSSAPPMADVAGDLTSELQQRAIEKRLDALLTAAKVKRTSAKEIDPAFLSDPDFHK